MAVEHASFGGRQVFDRHDSAAVGLPMKFGVYVPPGDVRGTVVCLAGLTCDETTFAVKSGAQRVAAELGLLLVTPDTSPRDTGIAGEKGEWDFGAGAGFYLDATAEPWSRHFRMESWIVGELLPLVAERYGADRHRIGICGHSMGGHGALTLALRNPGAFRSVSALAPIAAPSRCPWGEKAFTRYLGPDRDAWQRHDASALLREARTPFPNGILVDQGLADEFLAEQLHVDDLEVACALAAQPLTLRRHAGHGHGYWFIATFVEDHLRWHAERLSA